MDSIELYSEIESLFSVISRKISSIIDYNLLDQKEGEIKLLFESLNFRDTDKELKEKNEILQRRIDTLVEILPQGPLDVSKANLITQRNNKHTQDVIEIKEFIESSLKEVLNKFERMVLKEYIEEYRMKINLIYNLLYEYKRVNNVNLELPLKF